MLNGSGATCELRFAAGGGKEPGPADEYGAFVVTPAHSRLKEYHQPTLPITTLRPATLRDEFRWTRRAEYNDGNYWDWNTWCDAADGSLSIIRTHHMEIRDPIRGAFQDDDFVFTLHVALDGVRRQPVSFRQTYSERDTQKWFVDCVDMARVTP